MTINAHRVHIQDMKLSEWMEANHLNDAELARRLGGVVSRSQINRIRNGESTPSVETAKALERVTNIPAAVFVMGDAA